MSTAPIPIGQFAAAIRAKHPGAYDNRSDAELVQAYVTKYPAYKDRVAGFAKTDFEKEREGSDYFGGLAEALPSTGGTMRRLMTGGFDPVSDIQAIASLKNIPANFRTGVQNSKDIGLTDLPSRATSGTVNAIAPFVGIDPQAMRNRAEHADTAGIAGEATIPTVAALSPFLIRGAARARTGISNAAYTDGALNPKLASFGDALEHPTTIPGKLIKAGASTLFPPPEAPAPAWETPAHTDVLGSPDFPGAMSKLPTRLPKGLRGDPFAPPMVEATPVPAELGSPENPGPFSKIPNRIAPQYRGDPFQPPTGETIEMPTEWESADEAARRGASGVNPALKSIRRQGMGDDLISRMKKIAIPGEEPTASDLKRAGDLTQSPLERLKVLAKFGDKLAQNEINRRLRNQ